MEFLLQESRFNTKNFEEEWKGLLLEGTLVWSLELVDTRIENVEGSLFDLKVLILECSIIVDLLVAFPFREVAVRASKLFVRDVALNHANHCFIPLVRDIESEVLQSYELDSQAIHNKIQTSIYVILWLTDDARMMIYSRFFSLHIAIQSRDCNEDRKSHF